MLLFLAFNALFQLGLTLAAAAIIAAVADQSVRIKQASSLYLYLTGRGLDVVRRHGRIRSSKSGKVSGDGVYLSALPPINGGRSNLCRDLKSLRRATLDDKTGYFVCFRTEDLVGVKATLDRGVWLYPRDIDLARTTFTAGYAAADCQNMSRTL